MPLLRPTCPTVGLCVGDPLVGADQSVVTDNDRYTGAKVWQFDNSASPGGTGSCAIIRGHDPSSSGPNGVNVAAIAYRWWWRINTAMPSGLKVMMWRAKDQLGGNPCRGWINPDGTVSIDNAAGTQVEVGETVLVADTWYRFDLVLGLGETGTYELRIAANDTPGATAGAVELTGTMDLGSTNHGGIQIADAGFTNSSVVMRYDGPLFSSADDITADRVVWIPVVGDGALTDLSGDYTDVDDALPVHDGSATAITSSTPDAISSFLLGALPEDVGVIHAVQATALCIGAAGATTRPGLRIGSSVYQPASGYQVGATGISPDGYREQGHLLVENPDTEAPFEPADFDANNIQVTVSKSNESNASSCTALGIVIAYELAEAGEENDVAAALANEPQAMTAAIEVVSEDIGVEVAMANEPQAMTAAIGVDAVDNDIAATMANAPQQLRAAAQWNVPGGGNTSTRRMALRGDPELLLEILLDEGT